MHQKEALYWTPSKSDLSISIFLYGTSRSYTSRGINYIYLKSTLKTNKMFTLKDLERKKGDIWRTDFHYLDKNFGGEGLEGINSLECTKNKISLKSAKIWISLLFPPKQTTGIPLIISSIPFPSLRSLSLPLFSLLNTHPNKVLRNWCCKAPTSHGI